MYLRATYSCIPQYLYSCVVSVLQFIIICCLPIYFEQIVGVMCKPPDYVPSNLPSNNNIATFKEWFCSGECLYHNGRRVDLGLHFLDDVAPGDKIGLVITSSGSLHIYFNAKYMKQVAAGLPIDLPFWGAVDVYGICSRIKSEILSGKMG